MAYRPICQESSRYMIFLLEALSDIPLLRIDQIWTSDHFRAVRVRARKTEHSDHRMVVCDLLARAKRSNSSGNNG